MTPDPTRLQLFLAPHSEALAASLRSGVLSTCPADLPACQVALAICEAGCSAPPPGALVASGQTACWDNAGLSVPCAGTGQDGERQLGLAPVFRDNGDGTISDLPTGLVWEKLSDDGGPHDVDTLYTWDEAFAKVSVLNQMAFAGYTDWRLPNVIELRSLVSFRGQTPAVDPLFHDDCAPGCSIDACSCTAPDIYWTSTSDPEVPRVAYNIGFRSGQLLGRYKSTSSWRVRSVRGGH